MEFQKISRTKIILQNIFIVFFILIVALSAFSYFLSHFYFNNLVKEKFIKNFNSANANKYELTISSVSTNLLRGYILVKNAEIKQGKHKILNKYLFVENIKVPILEIKQINLFDLIKGNYLKATNFVIQNSVVNFVFNENPKEPDSADREMIRLGSSEHLREMSIDIFSINNANINIRNSLNDSVIFSAEAFNIELKDIRLNTAIENYLQKLDKVNDVSSLITAFKK